jgi:hypothetical protein
MRFIRFLPLFALAFLAGCSDSGGPPETICNSTGEAIYSNCDPTDPADVALIQNGFAAAGITLTAEEIADTDQAEFTALCVEEVSKQTDITDADAKEWETAISALNSCEAVVGFIIQATSEG